MFKSTQFIQYVIIKSMKIYNKLKGRLIFEKSRKIQMKFYLIQNIKIFLGEFKYSP